MADLKGILASRATFYAKAQIKVDTSAQPLEASFALLREQVRQYLGAAI
jgi:XRE family aerobic/anaerobic benzoate catabolism transcriptional regulator